MTAPYYSDDHVTIYHADCLELLRSEPIEVSGVITDPPYSSGTRKESGKPGRGSMLRGAHVGKARLSQPIDLDQMTTTGFVWTLRNVAMLAWPMLPDGGPFASFVDWRQWPTLVGVVESCNYRVQTMVVWDKMSMGLGNGFRNQHELVCHASKGVPAVADRGVPNVIQCRRDEPDSVGHPSPKPVPLLRRLVECLIPDGGCVLDPFAGAGSTLVAAKESGRRAVGIERNERYCEIAATRCAQEVLPL